MGGFRFTPSKWQVVLHGHSVGATMKIPLPATGTKTCLFFAVAVGKKSLGENTHDRHF